MQSLHSEKKNIDNSHVKLCISLIPVRSRQIPACIVVSRKEAKKIFLYCIWKDIGNITCFSVPFKLITPIFRKE